MKEANKENEFERLLKEKADRFEMKPAPEVWEQVQDAIQKDRRRRFGWWLMAALLFSVLGTGAFFMLQKKSYPPATPSTTENNSGQSSNTGNNSSPGTTSTERNPEQPDMSDNAAILQNQDIDNTLSKIHEEKIPKGHLDSESHSEFTSESADDRQMLNQVQHDNEYIASLPSRQFTLSSLEASVQARPFSKPLLDFSSLPSSKHSFYFEADAMALKSFVWNHNTSSILTMTVPVNKSSYSFTKGFSAGGNFFFEQNNKWLLGLGLHLTKTHLEAITAERSIPLYDISYISTGDTIVYESQHDVNQWFDISLMAGIKLFPDSKNHVRVVSGIGYSRLVSNKNSRSVAPVEFDSAFNTTTGGNTSAGFPPTPFIPYRKNQLQLFSEIAYQRDLTSRLSLAGGIQLHYYPMNLFSSNESSQRMMWFGLKGGLLIRL